jgi:antitoxin YefM
MGPDGERRARLALSFLAKPGDAVLGAALRIRTAAEVLALVTGADPDGEALLAGAAEDAALHRALPRWRERLGEIPSTARLAAWQDSGFRLIVPGDAEWPTQLNDLGDTRPLLLWLQGTADLRLTCVNSVAIVGSRAATGYGNHVAVEMAAVLAEHDVGVVSGGAYGTKTHRVRTTSAASLGATSGSRSVRDPRWTPPGPCATIVAMSIEPLRRVRDHLSEFVDRVENQHERIVVTRNGHAAAVLISPEDLAQLEETIDVLSDPAAIADIREADEAYARGDVVRGVEAVRKLRR